VPTAWWCEKTDCEQRRRCKNGWCGIAATQASHQPGIAPALGLRAASDDLVKKMQINSYTEAPTMLLRVTSKGRRRRLAVHRRSATRLHLEPLEDRALPSAGYQQLNLVGLQSEMGRRTDPKLNGWGMDFAPNGPFCVANTNTGVATFYDQNGKILQGMVTIPPAPDQPPGTVGSPTGVVYNSTSDFVITENHKSAPARFLFDTLDGTISGWNPDVDPNNAIIIVNNSTESPIPASYTGLALGKNGKGQNVLYGADSGFSPDVSNNRIDMFDGGWHSLGSFTDTKVNVPGSPLYGNTAFQVENVDGKLYVTFGGFQSPFGGVVDVFDTDGNLLSPDHFAANAAGAGPLENPWGVVQAPAAFGAFSKDLLIGNVEGAGNINAFDPTTGAFLGPLRQRDGTPIAIPGLWDLVFGGGGKHNGKTNELFFDAGPNVANFAGNGLFGKIVAKGQEDAGDGDGEHRADHWVGTEGAVAVPASDSAQHGGTPGHPPLQVVVGLSPSRDPAVSQVKSRLATKETGQTQVQPATSAFTQIVAVGKKRPSSEAWDRFLAQLAGGPDDVPWNS
jgi:uncharacterized protein (TIGR03118 family)